jgi:hypothetical protein
MKSRNVQLVHNKTMSYFEECLRLGEWLSEADRRALYKYLLECNQEAYKSQAKLLLKNLTLNKTVANGEIIVSIKNQRVLYIARELGSIDFTPEMRKRRLTGLRSIDIRKLKKFFAQSDVDVIQNFPLTGATMKSQSGFGIDAYPYYTIAYYADGKNYLKGIVRKLKTNDKELLTKLRAL